jgi:hypothetical protein
MELSFICKPKRKALGKSCCRGIVIILKFFYCKVCKNIYQVNLLDDFGVCWRVKYSNDSVS